MNKKLEMIFLTLWFCNLSKDSFADIFSFNNPDEVKELFDQFTATLYAIDLHSKNKFAENLGVSDVVVKT